jgi:hypothetical protein
MAAVSWKNAKNPPNDHCFEIRRFRTWCRSRSLPYGVTCRAAKVYSAAFEQSGIIQAANLDNLFDLTEAFELQPPMLGDHLLVITNGGGVGVLATDSAENMVFRLNFVLQIFRK